MKVARACKKNVLNEGRYYRNPYTTDWAIYPKVEIPEGYMGVRIRLYGDDLGYSHLVAKGDNEKGIVEEVLRPGRCAINAIVKDVNGTIKNPREKQDYVEIIEIHKPITIDAGYKGILTNVSGPMPEDPNQILVPEGFRGVQERTIEPGTHYLNPYKFRIEAIDLRSMRFNLSENGDMGFPSKDGFWVSLDGIIEFQIDPKFAASTYVKHNEEMNNSGEKHDIAEEIIRKVIMPNARAFCRLRGSNSSGRDFIGGETRAAFQKDFQEAISETCKQQGIIIVQALITKIHPPKPIAEPVREREVYVQKLKQYNQEKLQQVEAAKLQTEEKLIGQKTELVDADRTVVEKTTLAGQEQDIALEEASRDLEVAREELEAAKDKAEAMLAKAGADAAVIVFENQAKAAGWKKSVEAFGGDGQKYSQYVMYERIAPSFKSIMTNSDNSPFIKIFESFTQESKTKKPALRNKSE